MDEWMDGWMDRWKGGWMDNTYSKKAMVSSHFQVYRESHTPIDVNVCVCICACVCV